MDMTFFDEQENDLKNSRGKRDHRNKKASHNPEDVSDLRKKANKRSIPRNKFSPPEDEE